MSQSRHLVPGCCVYVSRAVTTYARDPEVDTRTFGNLKVFPRLEWTLVLVVLNADSVPGSVKRVYYWSAVSGLRWSYFAHMVGAVR